MNKEQKLCFFDLSESERARLLGLIDPLVRFLGSPGDWGYGTKLGDATLALIDLQNSVRMANTASIATQGE